MTSATPLHTQCDEIRSRHSAQRRCRISTLFICLTLQMGQTARYSIISLSGSDYCTEHRLGVITPLKVCARRLRTYRFGTNTHTHKPRGDSGGGGRVDTQCGGSTANCVWSRVAVDQWQQTSATHVQGVCAHHTHTISFVFHFDDTGCRDQRKDLNQLSEWPVVGFFFFLLYFWGSGSCVETETVSWHMCLKRVSRQN